MKNIKSKSLEKLAALLAVALILISFLAAAFISGRK